VKSKREIEILTRKIHRLSRVMTFQNSLLASHNEEGIACKTNQIHKVKFHNSDQDFTRVMIELGNAAERNRLLKSQFFNSD
jgi:hypothetical protein